MLPDKKITRVLFFFIILHGALLFFSPLLPFTDLPNHLAEALIYKYGSSGSMLGDYYERVPWFYPNTFHAFFCSFFPSVELGNKFFYLIYAAALVLSVDRIIKFLGGNRWYGLFSIFFIYNFNTVMGFSGFTMAIPALLFLFYFSLLEMQYDSFRYTVIIALGWLVIAPFVFPPSSILMAYWMGGAFLMACKRFAEYRFINDKELAVLYRRSFKVYTETSLLISIFFYALTSTFFLGIFLVKHRIELLLTFPLFALLFSWYLRISFRPDSTAQRPENLYQNWKFMIFIGLFFIFFMALLFVRIPVLHYFLQNNFG